MKKFRIEDMKQNWFIGAFEPSVYFTKDFEVGYNFHKAGDFWDAHYHEIATEITYLIRGQLQINNLNTTKESTIMTDGDIFIIEPGEAIRPIFITDCEVVIIKIPSMPGDKIVCPIK
jgi:quercetin dioxygenase-like cupin family protein